MAFIKGQSGNPNGRSKKLRIKSKIDDLLLKNLDRIEQEMDAASPDDRRQFFLNLASVVLPPRKQVSPPQKS